MVDTLTVRIRLLDRGELRLKILILFIIIKNTNILELVFSLDFYFPVLDGRGV
jgi:hypothetical protein